MHRVVAAGFVLAIGLQVAALVGQHVGNDAGVVVLGLTLILAPWPLVWLPGDRIPPATRDEPGDRCRDCGYPLGVAGHEYTHEQWRRGTEG